MIIIRDFVSLITRLVLGASLISHGLQKWNAWGMDSVISNFEKMGTPNPQVSAYFAFGAEFFGGILLILGLLTPLAGLAVAVAMAGAVYYGHWGTTILNSEGGWELPALIGVAALMLAAYGPGRLAIDQFIPGLRQKKPVQAVAEKTPVIASPETAPVAPPVDNNGFVSTIHKE